VIAVRPDAHDPLPWRVLVEIVTAPGELRSDDLADLLCPVRLAPQEGAHGPAWTRLGLAPILRHADDWRAIQARRRAARARVARILSRLVAQGLVEPRRELVELSEWGRGRIEAMGFGIAIQSAIDDEAEPADDDELPDWIDGDPDADEGPAEVDPDAQIEDGALRSILVRVAASPLPPREARGTDSGAAHRAYARLADLGLICTPSHRWPTAAGVALVDRLSVAP
jgi:hypothetical protein